jgi:predicted RNA-binding Zn-ribbon protein involved in translation (DUF1610 family)
MTPQLQDASWLARKGLQPPTRERYSNGQMASVTYPYRIDVEGYLRGRFLEFACPHCGKEQIFKVHVDTGTGIAMALTSLCCQKTLIVKVQGRVAP